jgi:hypothetical protein
VAQQCCAHNSCAKQPVRTIQSHAHTYTLQDYNRELAAKDAGDMEQWLSALQTAMDAADTGEGLPQQLEEMRNSSSNSNNNMNSNSGSNMQHYGDNDGTDSYADNNRGNSGANVTNALNAAAQRVVSMSTMAVSRGFRVDQVRLQQLLLLLLLPSLLL